MSITREVQSPESVEIERQCIMSLIWPKESPNEIHESMKESGVKINPTSIAVAVKNYKKSNEAACLGGYSFNEAMRSSEKRSDSENFLIRYKSCLKKRDSTSKMDRKIASVMKPYQSRRTSSE
jgi:hypothetical protein